MLTASGQNVPASRCRFCGRPRPINMPTCRDCAPLWRTWRQGKRARRRRIQEQRAAARIERFTRRADLQLISRSKEA